MKKIIITGADGFIGTHLIQYMVRCGYEVFAVVMPESQTKYRICGKEHVHVIEGNLNKYEDIIKFLPQDPIAFFHLAWAGVTPDQRNDFTFQMQNIKMSENAVRLASFVNAKKFILPGSTLEYIYYGKPIDKDAIPSPSNAYGVAKISARYTCSVLCKNFGIAFEYVVISGIYSEDRSDNNVIYYVISKLLHGERPSLTKLEQLWDYVHIDDVVYGLRLIAERGIPGSFYALGHGDNWSLYNYIYKIRDAIDPKLPLGIGDIPYQNNEMPCSCVNLSSIYEDTGFVPEVSFEMGIKKVIEAVKIRESGETEL